MNEKLNLCEILKDCPKGTRLYSSIHGDVTLEAILTTPDIYPIVFRSEKTDDRTRVTLDGRYFSSEDGECILFPSKDQRDWSKFEVPVKTFDPKTFQPFDKVLTRTAGVWVANFFGFLHKDKTNIMAATTGGLFPWEQCIPYNDETKHLLGTTDDCPEYYKWWE